MAYKLKVTRRALAEAYKTYEWLAKQSWCTGNIGTFGSSQGGYAQNFLAVTQPPHLSEPAYITPESAPVLWLSEERQ